MSHPRNANAMNGNCNPAGIRDGTRVVLREITSSLHNSPPTHPVHHKSPSNTQIVKTEHEVKVQFTREFVDVGPSPSRSDSPASTSSFRSLASTLSVRSCNDYSPDTPQKAADTSYTNKEIFDVDNLIAACGNIRLNDQEGISSNDLGDSTLTFKASDESFREANSHQETSQEEIFVSAIGNSSNFHNIENLIADGNQIQPNNTADSNYTAVLTPDIETSHEVEPVIDSSVEQIEENCTASNRDLLHSPRTSVNNTSLTKIDDSSPKVNLSENLPSNIEKSEQLTNSNNTIDGSLPNIDHTFDLKVADEIPFINASKDSAVNSISDSGNVKLIESNASNLTGNISGIENNEAINSTSKHVDSNLDETCVISVTEPDLNNFRLDSAVNFKAASSEGDKNLVSTPSIQEFPASHSPEIELPSVERIPDEELKLLSDVPAVPQTQEALRSDLNSQLTPEEPTDEILANNSQSTSIEHSNLVEPITSGKLVLETPESIGLKNQEQCIAQIEISPSENPIEQPEELVNDIVDSNNIQLYSSPEPKDDKVLVTTPGLNLTRSVIQSESLEISENNVNTPSTNTTAEVSYSTKEEKNNLQDKTVILNDKEIKNLIANQEKELNEEIATNIAELDSSPPIRDIPIAVNQLVAKNEVEIAEGNSGSAIQTNPGTTQSSGTIASHEESVPYIPNNCVDNAQGFAAFKVPESSQNINNITPYPQSHLSPQRDLVRNSETIVLHRNNSPNQDLDKTITFQEESFHSANSDTANEPYTAFQPQQQSTELPNNSDSNFKKFELAAQVIAEEFHNKSLEIAEESEQFFNADSDLYLDPASFDFLLARTSSKNPVRDLGRESLYIKFDPLVGNVNMLPQGPTHTLDSEDTAKHSIPTPTLDTPKRNPALAVIDRLLIYSPAAGTPIKMEEPAKIEDQVVQEIKQEEIPIVDANMAKELELVRSMVVQLDSQIENQKKEFQQELEKQRTRYEMELSQKTKDNKKMALVLDEYEKSISRQAADHGREIATLKQEKSRLQEELQAAMHHLSNTEAAFNDVHLKYERLKGVVSVFKSNESVLKDSITENVDTIKTLNAKYDELKSHAMAELEKANKELGEIQKKHEGEIVKLQAMLRKAELKSNSLAEIVEQKVKENKELTEIFEEVIARVGHKSNN